MLVFIDESGCPGMKVEGASTAFFTVTLLAFEDHDEATACDQRIGLLKRELGWRDHEEFHFNKMRPDYRRKFLEAVAPYQFFYFAIVLNKSKLSGKGFQFPDSFYKYTCNLVFQNAKPHLSNAIVVIDGSGSRKFRLELSTYLRKRINDAGSGVCHIKKVKLQNSHANHLLQMADVVCGAVARSFTDKPDAKEYRQIISHREFSVQYWPR